MFANVIPSSIVSKIICGVLLFAKPPGMSSPAHLHEGRRQVKGSQGDAGAKVQTKAECKSAVANDSSNVCTFGILNTALSKTEKTLP